MTTKLNAWQINMLITGKKLGAETQSTSQDRRAFVYVEGYSVDPRRQGRPSVFLNADHSDVRFSIRVFELDKALVGSPYDTDYYEQDVTNRDEIATIAELEEILGAYLSDLAVLDDYAKLEV